jgi:uncharacterized Zn-binding protein involved in type VI secretion
MPAAARLTDAHACPIAYPLPHVGGVVQMPGVGTVLIGHLPAATQGSACVCPGGPPNAIAGGSTTVMIGGKAAARVGDATTHGGSVITGYALLQIGG